MAEGDARLSELEEKVGRFQREAQAAAAEIAELEQTVDALVAARGRLLALVERARKELESWRGRAKALATLEVDLGARAKALENEREKLLSEVSRMMDNAEAVRREGIEALEQARQIEAQLRRPPQS